MFPLPIATIPGTSHCHRSRNRIQNRYPDRSSTSHHLSFTNPWRSHPSKCPIAAIPTPVQLSVGQDGVQCGNRCFPIAGVAIEVSHMRSFFVHSDHFPTSLSRQRIPPTSNATLALQRFVSSCKPLFSAYVLLSNMFYCHLIGQLFFIICL